MRLPKVDHGHALPEKLVLGVIRIATGHRVPDVLRTLKYRPAYFGRQMSKAVQDCLRGPSEWTVGERELFACFTSKVNDCEF